MIIEKRSRTLGWISRLPLPFVQLAGAAVGWLAYALSATYRRRLRQQALAAGATPAQVRAAVAHAGRLSAEVAWLWLRDSTRPLGALVEWEGGELIEQALARGQGLVMLTPHLGMFEVAGRAYAERWGARQPMTVLYRPARQAWLAEVQRWARVHPGLAPAPASLAGVRQLLRALKMGQTLGLLPDQVPPEGQGVWAPFFGRPAYTMTLAARLIHHARGSAVVLWCERKSGGRGFRIHVRPMPALPGTDDAADAAAVNATMESLVRERPGQYLWGYNRYKGPRPAETREEPAG